MAIVPTVRCSDIRRSLDFYINVLDFRRADDSDSVDFGFAALIRAGDPLFLSTGSGDGEFGQAIVVMTEDVDALFEKFLARGLVRPDKEGPVHQGSTDQSWGTRVRAFDNRAFEVPTGIASEAAISL
jgi:catechol 2,3-dioxygenase-like lactoylglutathione lyase family enzyme